MCAAADVAFVLLGRIQCANSSFIRLPVEVCLHIAVFTTTTTYRWCADCGVRLLELCNRTPFVSHLQTSWAFDGRSCLVTNRGIVLCSYGTDTEDVHMDTDEIHITSLAGIVTPKETPRWISLRHESGQSLRFRNIVRTMNQCEWYSVIDGRPLCRHCCFNVRRRRLWFRTLKHSQRRQNSTCDKLL